MRLSRRSMFAAGAILALGVTGVVASGARAPSKQSAASARIARGRYLTTVAGCNDCHTPGTLFGKPDMSRELSGSELGWKGPWGVSYARNLTPDKETGIGTWTEAQIIHAIMHGQRPDGTALLPPMPWPMYAQLTPADARAIAAYLKSLPPVTHHVPDRIAPDQPATGAMLVFPPPPDWDAPR